MGERPGTRRPLKSHERTLLETLVRDCGPRLLGYVRRAYGTCVDAEEIVAESFCRAAANIEALQRCERHDMYLLTIARNLCRDHFRQPTAVGRLRAAPPNPRQNPGPGLSDCPARAPLPSDTLDHSERHRALRDAVSALPETEREVVTLRLSGTLKFAEIAELLDVPLGTVLSRMHSALQRLKQHLGATDEP